MAVSTQAQATVPESVYYARHFRLPGFDEATQDRLRAARVLVVGVGGLGCPAALYLASAGVGTIALLDGDEVSPTNLHRQILFDLTSIGRKKVDVAADRLRAINPHVRIVPIAAFAHADTLAQFVGGYDLVLDGTDNFASKYAINDACEAAGVPLVYGSIFQFEGQVSVFHHPTAEYPQGVSYRDLYPDAPPKDLAQNCGEAGVIGVLPGTIGTLQAAEAIKVITKLGEPLSGTLMIFDALTARFQRLRLSPRQRAGNDRRSSDHDEVAYANISYSILQDWLSTATPPFLIDVRETWEREIASIGGEHIPLTLLPQRLADVPAHRDVVLYCRSGVRSARAALYLKSVRPGARVFNLQGGVDAALVSGRVCAA